MKHVSFIRHGLVLVALTAVGHFSVHAQGVGIGTTTPAGQLDVVPAAWGANATVDQQQTTGNANGGNGATINRSRPV